MIQGMSYEQPMHIEESAESQAKMCYHPVGQGLLSEPFNESPQTQKFHQTTSSQESPEKYLMKPMKIVMNNEEDRSAMTQDEMA